MRRTFPKVSDRELNFATYLAPSIRPVYELVTQAVGEALGRPTSLVTGRSFAQLTDGTVHFAFVCGLPYVRFSGHGVRAIAAPVVTGERYGGRPIYFSDVIVPSASSAQVFGDLRGCSWAYNEPDSHSGYLVTLHHLLEMGETSAFFGRWERTGYHQESVRRVAAGDVDASAVDSQVLAVALRDHPKLAERVRVIAALGPSTIQPLVATAAVSDALTQEVKSVVTSLDDPWLARWLVERFVSVNDSSYADIRAMLESVEAAGPRLDPAAVRWRPKRTFGAKSAESRPRPPTLN
jgi:phosphonate transport system substrate-binding protein